MPLDPYSPCPAGTGKKLKFCCADLVGELEKIQRMLEGDQRLACLEHIEKLQTKYPGRACLMTSQALLLLGQGRKDDAKRVIDAVLAQAAANPVALAESALVTFGEGELRKGIETLQLALSACPAPMPVTVVDVIATVAETLVGLDEIPSALGHLLLLASLLPQDQHTLALLMRINGSPQVPLLFKEEPDFLPAPAGASWKAKFDEALEPAHRGAWRVAADKFTALAATAGDAPALWHNLAVLRSWLADDAGAVEALRKLSALDVPTDDAVEAEALAQLLDPATTGETLELISIEYPIKDIETLNTRLANRHFLSVPVNTSAWTERNEAPPQGSYALLDREAPRTGVGIAREAVPNIIGHVLVFGRQTDREARLEMSLARPNLAAARDAIAQLCGDQLGPAGDEEKRGEISATQWALSWNGRLPEDTPVDEVHQLLVAQRRHAILDRWTQTPLAVLGGLTPAAAAKDPGQKIRLLGAILVLELSFQEASIGDVFTALRSKLGLPEPGPVDPAQNPVEDVPLARLHRVEWEKASDEALILGNRRAGFTAARLASRRIAEAALERESLKGRIDRAQLYGLLARLDDDTSRAINYLEKARTASEDANKSTAMWDLEELTLRLERGEPHEFSRLIQHIQAHHSREPGVAQALMQILVEAGLVTPDGRPVHVPQEATSPLVVPGAGAEPGKIWTPESEAGPGKKSALWVPGE
ncbi:MAG TPA: hypothetical protein VHD36_20490 [Pirellulales bacterium]|nr:hypothetical protein [Pirellulales bacterium]